MDVEVVDRSRQPRAGRQQPQVPGGRQAVSRVPALKSVVSEQLIRWEICNFYRLHLDSLVQHVELEHHAGDDHREARPQRGVQVAVDKGEHWAGHAARHHPQGGAEHLELHQAACPAWVTVFTHSVANKEDANEFETQSF